MLKQANQLPLLNLAAPLLDEPCCRVLQHYRLKREATRTVSLLDQATTAQSLHSFQHLPYHSRNAQDSQEVV